jgi:hypothetical protein
MAEAEAKKTSKEILRYATEQLHAVRPQPSGIPEALDELNNSLLMAEIEAAPVEDTPKDLGEALGRIDAALGKAVHPPKEKPDLKKHLTEVGGGQGPATVQEPKPKKV